jgi:beta-glucosidase
MAEEYSEEELAQLPFMNGDLDLEHRVEDLLSRLELREKIMLLAGRKIFYTKPINRLGIPHLKMTDGPHGIGPHSSKEQECTYFPVGICRAATWNPELSEKFGIAVGQEVRDIGYHMLLGPAVNIQRAPLCGRNFEYQTEDPHLNKILTVEYVKGIQSQRISACVKHFICNNQETNRFTCNSIVSERALQEIYLPAFKASVVEADAWSFMSCYNKVNGIYGSENKNLLTVRLMDEWGFRGYVVSDWGATAHCSSEGCVNAGLSLEMPATLKYKPKRLRRKLEEGKFAEEKLNDNVKRILRVMFLTGVFDDPKTLPPGSRNTPEHQAIARRIAEEGIVLLKNDNNFLPLDLNSLKKIAVIGPNADLKISDGGGSSRVRPPHDITPLEGIREKCKGKVELVNLPSEADVVIYVTGLNHSPNEDCEGRDRRRLSLTSVKNNKIVKSVQENPHTIVVLINGSPIAMDWVEKVPAIIEAWYPGMEGGRALASILFGDVNPSGKLPITFPKILSDSPGQIINELDVKYEEDIFVGYRHFDKNGIEPLFPFGYGLSYASFVYENLKIDKDKVSASEGFAISFDVTNSGNRAGAEVVQLYVQDVECSVERPPKELKGFKKVFIEPGEKKAISFKLGDEDLSFYDQKENCWKAEKGIFNILVGSSSRDIRLEGKIEYSG